MKTGSYSRTSKLLLLGIVGVVSLATLTMLTGRGLAVFTQDVPFRNWESRSPGGESKAEGDTQRLRHSRPDAVIQVSAVLPPQSDAPKNPPAPQAQPEPVVPMPPSHPHDMQPTRSTDSSVAPAGVAPPVPGAAKTAPVKAQSTAESHEPVSTEAAKQDPPQKVEGIPQPEKMPAIVPIQEGLPISSYCCGGGAGNCIPGRLHCCSPCDGSTLVGRIFCGFYEALCCPDPCYEPRWIAQANNAFFVESARPITHTRIRWDYGHNFTFPDIAEYFWAKIGGRGPAAPGPNQIRYHELTMYTEAAAGGAGVMLEIPYRSISDVGSGFADMMVGTKSVLFDQEIMQVTFMFKTFLPVGKTGAGLGTGHVSLEPSLLSALKLTADTYLQTQISEWIPIGGDPAHSGAMLHYHVALNQVLFRALPDVPLIGSIEFSGYSFQDGQFTLPAGGGVNNANGVHWFYAGPGIRLVVCDKLDLGFGAAFALDRHGPEQLYRTEFRFRY